MDANVRTKPNIRQAIPFFTTKDMQRSLRFYVDGLGFELKNSWTPRGTIEWCLLQRDGVALMLQEYRKDLPDRPGPAGRPAEGITCFQCEDALELYHEFLSKGITLAEPFVGNGMWDVGCGGQRSGWILLTF